MIALHHIITMKDIPAPLATGCVAAWCCVCRAAASPSSCSGGVVFTAFGRLGLVRPGVKLKM